MTDSMKATVVTMSYIKMIRLMRGGFYRKSVPKKGKLMDNCAKFYDASVEMKVGVYPMMLVGLERFSSGWLEQRFGTPYPPFTLITCAPGLTWIRKQMPETVNSSNVDQVSDGIMDSLKGLDRLTARELIESGVVCGENRLLKETLLGRLTWARAEVIK